MSLKYLFFPVVLFLAAVAFWLFIWPAIMSLQTVNNEYKVSQKNLINVQEKRTALETLNSQLKSGDKNGALVAEYLPTQKSEEKIIGQVNSLASAAGIFLDNIEITKSQEQSASITNLAPVPVGIVGAEPLAVVPVVANTQAVVTVSGDYNKLKAFFDGIQHMPLFNSVKSLEITSLEKTLTDPNATAVKTPEFIISAKLTLDFGHLNRVQIDNNNLKSFQPEIDSKTLQNLGAYIATKDVPAINTSDITTGVSNPFLP